MSSGGFIAREAINSFSADRNFWAKATPRLYRARTQLGCFLTVAVHKDRLSRQSRLRLMVFITQTASFFIINPD